MSTIKNPFNNISLDTIRQALAHADMWTRIAKAREATPDIPGATPYRASIHLPVDAIHYYEGSVKRYRPGTDRQILATLYHQPMAAFLGMVSDQAGYNLTTRDVVKKDWMPVALWQGSRLVGGSTFFFPYGQKGTSINNRQNLSSLPFHFVSLEIQFNNQSGTAEYELQAGRRPLRTKKMQPIVDPTVIADPAEALQALAQHVHQIHEARTQAKFPPLRGAVSPLRFLKDLARETEVIAANPPRLKTRPAELNHAA